MRIPRSRLLTTMLFVFIAGSVLAASYHTIQAWRSSTSPVQKREHGYWYYRGTHTHPPGITPPDPQVGKTIETNDVVINMGDAMEATNHGGYRSVAYFVNWQVSLDNWCCGPLTDMIKGHIW